MTSSARQVTLLAECLCASNSFASSSSLPLQASACHCTSCRRMTGALFSMCVVWPEKFSSIDVSSLRRYEMTSRLHFLFCSTCSSPIFFHKTKEDTLMVLTGALRNDDLTVDLTRNIFVADTTDGGAAPWLRRCRLDAPSAPIWTELPEGPNVEELKHPWPGLSTIKDGYLRKNASEVQGGCHCGRVKFTVRCGAYDEYSEEALPWFIDPHTKKNLAGFDACNTCRRSFGVELVNWTFSELKNLSFGEDDEHDFPSTIADLAKAVDQKQGRIGTLVYFQSSPDVRRYFCSRCSASIFYAVDDRAAMINISIGVLHLPDGARAETFLSWAFGKVGWKDEVNGTWRENLINAVEEDCETWRIQRSYPKSWRRVLREEAEAKGQEFY